MCAYFTRHPSHPQPITIVCCGSSQQLLYATIARKPPTNHPHSACSQCVIPQSVWCVFRVCVCVCACAFVSVQDGSNKSGTAEQLPPPPNHPTQSIDLYSDADLTTISKGACARVRRWWGKCARLLAWGAPCLCVCASVCMLYAICTPNA